MWLTNRHSGLGDVKGNTTRSNVHNKAPKTSRDMATKDEKKKKKTRRCTHCRVTVFIAFDCCFVEHKILFTTRACQTDVILPAEAVEVSADE